MNSEMLTLPNPWLRSVGLLVWHSKAHMMLAFCFLYVFWDIRVNLEFSCAESAKFLYKVFLWS